MARWLTVLVALVAQGLALMSPACFVRCLGADGHQCVELAGRDCHCCDCSSQERSPEVCAVATCGHDHENEEQEEHDAPAGWQLRGEHCSCQHSPLDSAPQVKAKSLVSSGIMQALDFVTTMDCVAVVRALENVNLFASGGLRPHESPQLAALATIVLRV